MQTRRNEFLHQQEKRILQRIRQCERVARSDRLDAALKAQKVLPAQKHVLARLQSGIYGVCISCGQKIPHERLVKMPAALRCVPCQKDSEQ